MRIPNWMEQDSSSGEWNYTNPTTEWRVLLTFWIFFWSFSSSLGISACMRVYVIVHLRAWCIFSFLGWDGVCYWKMEGNTRVLILVFVRVVVTSSLKAFHLEVWARCHLPHVVCCAWDGGSPMMLRMLVVFEYTVGNILLVVDIDVVIASYCLVTWGIDFFFLVFSTFTLLFLWRRHYSRLCCQFPCNCCCLSFMSCSL